MSHKVDPRIYRIRGIGDWKSRGFYNKQTSKYLEEDFRIRKYIDKKIGRTGVEKVEIERFRGKINIIIYSARPGLIIGRGGEGIEQLRKEIDKILKEPVFYDIIEKNKKAFIKNNNDTGKKDKENEPEKNFIKIEIREVKNVWLSAQLVAQWAAQRLEKRIAYRRVAKEAMGKITLNKEVKGARVEFAGRLNGTEIARREWFGTGQLPRQTLRSDIDYAKDEAHCTYGAIGIKVWIYKGEKF
jgi:small subunit ribosomal protein S3